ncbi:CALX-like protein, partial [Mya arenaria]
MTNNFTLVFLSRIPDPDASKPEDWDEDQPIEIPDESAVKPDGWLDDEQPLIPDPDAAKPDDWDEEMDGEWEAPLIENPECQNAPGCGEWNRPNIPNPLYKGKVNGSQEGSPTPTELWSMTDEIVFDNFIITDDREEHTTWLQQTWEKKNNAELYSSGALVQGILDVTQDRPWLWAVFLVVVVLPVVLLVAYCCISKDKGGVWSTLTGAAEERPWLYAVYVVVLLLPIVLLSICLCPRSGPI